MSARSRATQAPSSGVDLPQRASGLRQFLLPAALLIVLSFAAYWPAIQAGFVWDDDAYITENPKLHDLSGLRDIWFDIGATKMYVPLVFTTFWLEHQLWGTRPLGYHLVNIAFHAAGAVLLWLLLVRLAVPGAWLAAAIFAVHPIYVESVAWVTELKNTQSTLFGLLFLLAYWRFSETGGRAGAARRPWGFYLLALSAFAAALLSKPVVVALPLVLLLLLWWRRWGGSGRSVTGVADIAAVLPMLVLSTAAGLVAIHVEHIYGGARGAPWQLPFLDRGLVAGRALWFYVGKLFWPVDLVPIYPRWQIDSAAAGQYLYPLGAAGVLAALWYFRRQLGRGPFVAAASFALLLAPLIGFFAVSYHLNSYVADHFQHHAAPALIALVAAGAAALPRRFPQFRRLAPWMAAALLAVLALASNRYTPAFENEEARCRTTLERNPDSWLAMNNLGVALNRQGRFAEATGWFEKAIRIRQPYPEAESNLGVALVGLGRPQAAIEHYREALRIWPENPLAHNNLGTALAQVGQIEEARAEYEVALRLRPEYPEARSNLARLLATQAARAEPSASARAFAEAVRLDPGSAEAHNGLGMALARQQRWAEAIRELGEALRIRPDYAEARNNLGTALAASGDTQGAVAQFAASVRLQPGSVDAQLNLATALLSTGRPAEALVPLEAAANLAPRNGHAHLLLGVCLAQMDRLPEARRHFEEALRIDPEDQEARANLERVDTLLPPRP
jgi:Flp pilus assembly protein TadD